MTNAFMRQRRHLLLSTAAWLGGCAAFATAGPARAFQVQEIEPRQRRRTRLCQPLRRFP